MKRPLTLAGPCRPDPLAPRLDPYYSSLFPDRFGHSDHQGREIGSVR